VAAVADRITEMVRNALAAPRTTES
jgi:hypothetical protein